MTGLHYAAITNGDVTLFHRFGAAGGNAGLRGSTRAGYPCSFVHQLGFVWAPSAWLTPEPSEVIVSVLT